MRVLGYLAAGVAALLAAFLLWEAAFALAVAMHSHSWTLWQRFAHGHELLLPLQAATARVGQPGGQKDRRAREPRRNTGLRHRVRRRGSDFQ